VFLTLAILDFISLPPAMTYLRNFIYEKISYQVCVDLNFSSAAAKPASISLS
jgi:hypothetical protein